MLKWRKEKKIRSEMDCKFRARFDKKTKKIDRLYIINNERVTTSRQACHVR